MKAAIIAGCVMLSVLSAATPCHSAEITIYRGEIIVTGRIEQDDYEKFLGTAAWLTAKSRPYVSPPPAGT